MNMNIEIISVVVRNGYLAGPISTFVGAMALCGFVVFAMRLWKMRFTSDKRRLHIFFWLTILLGCLSAHRFTVTLYYLGYVGSVSIFPVLFSAGVGLSLAALAYEFTKDLCGYKGVASSLIFSALLSLFVWFPS